MSCCSIMAVLVNHRVQYAQELQRIFTKYGCLIKVRLGLHEAGNACSDEGLIILQLTGDKTEIAAFQDELNNLEGIKANTMDI